jgi:cyanophycinase-like exopeptidase
VIGEGAVMVFTGRVTHTSAPTAGGDETLAITDSILHVLADGYGFDLRAGRPMLPDGSVIGTVAETDRLRAPVAVAVPSAGVGPRR